MTKGQRIKYLREQKQMLQVDLANRIKVSKQTLYKYENDIITNIPSDKIEALAKVFGVTENFLMGWEDESLDFSYQPEWEEQELLELWRNASEPIRQSVLILLKSEIK